MSGVASARGLLYGAASTVFLAVAGLWWSVGSFSTHCVTGSRRAPDGTVTMFDGCTSADSRYEADGLSGVWWFGLPAAVALLALTLTPLVRVRAPSRWLVGVAALTLGLLTVFTPFVLLLLPAGLLMILAAVHADAGYRPVGSGTDKS